MPSSATGSAAGAPAAPRSGGVQHGREGAPANATASSSSGAPSGYGGASAGAHRQGAAAGSDRDRDRDRDRADRERGVSDKGVGASASGAVSGAAAPSEHGGQVVAAASADAAGAPNAGPGGAPMSNYAFFVRYTYSNECALLAYNFHKLVTKLGIFEQFAYRHDHRLISVTLAYIFYRYQVHHCDMALDLAVTLVYLEDVRAASSDVEVLLQEHSRDAFNLICYLAFLAHAFNADRTIRLADWYKEIGWRSFKNCQQLNGYVFFLFSKVRNWKLRVSETRVKRYIQKLCSVPNQIHGEN